jgi:hypothetical protein
MSIKEETVPLREIHKTHHSEVLAIKKARPCLVDLLDSSEIKQRIANAGSDEKGELQGK